MNSILFFDTEIDPKSKKILDIGGVRSEGNIFHSNSLTDFMNFIKGSSFICGHNIIHHDLKYLQKHLFSEQLEKLKCIDTLFFSPLLFPTRPYHALLKDDKIQTEELNNPVNDSQKAKDLFFDEVQTFHQLDATLQEIYYLLLKEQDEFKYFFEYISLNSSYEGRLSDFIRSHFQDNICSSVCLDDFIEGSPTELAYCLALINSTDRYSITPPWVLMNYPKVETILYLLRNNPCIIGCNYCDEALDPIKGLKDFFGFDSYRTYNEEPLQENAVRAAIQNKSLLAVFPTGGGKSLTFQIPALMSGRNSKGLTVVISPLQSLMKDQVDNLEKSGITESVTINGMLDPIERGKSFERVENGSASILYISPESLRSKTIERLLLGRNIARFVVDEAHCFSSWGQDFRVDYLYIADFIKQLQQKKNLSDPIPVSCFTATAKQQVIYDICNYFQGNLGLDLEVYSAKGGRTNLHYQVYNNADEEEKYNQVRALIESKKCPVIVYVSRTRKAYQLAERLSKDGFNAKPYHGKMDVQEKTANQNDFIAGKVCIMVATSAFGMGVDKKDVGMVIHYEISDSLENYVQEAGRAGRDENISAECFVLFNEEDLSKHFILLNQTKLSIKEIQQIWRAIKYITKFRSTVSNSALEIARKAGWDDNVMDVETRVKTAVSALEQAGYIKRGQNTPRIFATSILSKNAQQAIEQINKSSRFDQHQKMQAVRIIKKLFSTKSKQHSNDEVAEARVDYISDHLGIVKEEVIKVITLLREEKILADTKDLTAYIKKEDTVNRSLNILDTFAKIENFLLPLLDGEEQIFNVKELNESAMESNCTSVNPNKILTVFNFWAIKNWIKIKHSTYSKNHISIVPSQAIDVLKSTLEKRNVLAKFILNNLFEKTKQQEGNTDAKEILVEFSVHELRDAYLNEASLFKMDVAIEDVENALFYLSRIEALKIEGGFLVVYNKLTIDRIEKNNQIQYKKEDYTELDQFYKNKMQQIHIVGEYAKKMLQDYEDALAFVDDYFQLNYSSFLHKYFPGSRGEEIQRNITPKKFEQLFGALSPRQLKIINDKEHQNILVAAGPGSGKTRVLVHKLASLLLMEDVKHEQLLMLTFSRAAATEFKKRLLDLIGNAASFIEIKTFHSYCFDLLGRVGSLEKSDEILKLTVEKIKSGEVEMNRIVKNVLVIDEAQDMDAHEFSLVKALMDKNDELRVIAVGDDDQNIYTFRGADSANFEQFNKDKSATKYELVENYRSYKNLVEFTNQFVQQIKNRFKTTSIVPVSTRNGSIKIVQYEGAHFAVPVVADVLGTGLSGTTGILTKTNEEALQITGMLLKKGIPAKLIQSNDGFNLYNLVEIRFFIEALNLNASASIIGKENWNNAKKQFATKFKSSANYELCKSLLVDFQETNRKVKYVSDFEIFIKESKLEDFNSEQGETINVSTIHKAKGKEFDNVFLVLDNFNANSDDAKRQLYVAMTRAKQHLTIHYNGSFLNHLKAEELRYINYTASYALPKQLVYHLTHRDINLGYFKYVQSRIHFLNSGGTLKVCDTGLINLENEQVLKFSKDFLVKIESLATQEYQLVTAKTRFIMFWYPREDKGDVSQELKIILPELYFERKFNK